MGKLMTFEQLAEEFNLPSPRTVHTLRRQGLPTVKLGRSRLVDFDDMLAFIERKKEVRPPPVEWRLGRVQTRPYFGDSAAVTEAYEKLFALKRKPPKK
jgi:Helix-turn-helix domain